MTSIFVTHDQEEAFEVADEVVVMNQGRIEQRTPEQVFDRPANRFVMDFLGNVNVFYGRVQGGRAHCGPLSLAFPEYPHPESKPVAVYVRPHELEIMLSPNGQGSVEARVQRINPTGSVVKIGLTASRAPCRHQCRSEHGPLCRTGGQGGRYRLGFAQGVRCSRRTTRIMSSEHFACRGGDFYPTAVNVPERARQLSYSERVFHLSGDFSHAPRAVACLLNLGTYRRV